MVGKTYGIVVAKVVAFLICFVCLFVVFCNVLKFNYSRSMSCFYDLPENSVDVLVVGASHAYRNFDPSILYEEEGITSYVMGSPSAMIWNSYYYLEEALKTQKPKVVFFECFKTYITDDYSDEPTAIKSIANMKFSKTRIDNTNASFENVDNYIDYYLLFPLYHGNYEDISWGELKKNYSGFYDYYLGYAPRATCKEKLDDSVRRVKKRKPLTDKTEEYLEKVIELTRENDIELVFLLTPFAEAAAKRQPYYNSLADFAEKNNIPLINENLLYEELGLDGQIDFAEGNHLSKEGVKKSTKYLLEYIMENYDLPNHKGDSYYARWQKNLESEYREAEDDDLYQ